MYSSEHQKYLKSIKKEKYLIKFFQLIIIALFLLIWQLLANYSLINTFITSSPKNVLNTIISLHQSNNLYHHIFVTAYETIISFVLGTFIGLFIASILWWNKFLAKVLDPYLTVLNSLPKVALGPIIIIWSGAGMKSIILMALLISVIITIINLHQAFKNTDQYKIKLLQSFNASKMQIYLNLILPYNFNTIISSLKVSVSMSLIGVIMGELLVSKEGIGYLIMYGSQVFNLNLVMTGILLLCLLSVIMYLLVSLIEKMLIKN